MLLVINELHVWYNANSLIWIWNCRIQGSLNEPLERSVNVM